MRFQGSSCATWIVVSGGLLIGGCAQSVDSGAQGAETELARPAAHVTQVTEHAGQGDAAAVQEVPEQEAQAGAEDAASPAPQPSAAKPEAPVKPAASAAMPEPLTAAQPPAAAQQPTAAAVPSSQVDCGCHDDPRRAQLGEKLFNDPSLSASGTLSCAGCHGDALAGSGNNKPGDPLFPVSLGAFPNLAGNRNAPTTHYAAFSPAFSIQQETEEGETEFVPVGGQFWDGRADSLAAQAGGPFLNPREMAMPDKASVIAKVRAADYAPLFREVFGEASLDDVEHAYLQLTQAIEAFEKTDTFAPFDSKFDAVLRGETELSAEEAEGFALFKDPEKGNCLGCHVGELNSHDPHDWLFTDFTFDNIGVPRNAQIADNDDPEAFDLGLCKQPGLRERVPAPIADPDAYVQGLCGAFKVPTLRNIARTAPYMHNGFFPDLRAVVDFYATRDTDPGKWFPADGEGHVRKFDDVPAGLRENVNTSEAPLDRKLGDAPRLSEHEIDAIVAFLQTLSDGYR